MVNTMEYNGYHADIEFDAEDQIFVGHVLGIADALYFHGTSASELEEMFHQSIDNYLTMCEQVGKAPEKEHKSSRHVRLSREKSLRPVSGV